MKKCLRIQPCGYHSSLLLSFSFERERKRREEENEDVTTVTALGPDFFLYSLRWERRVRPYSVGSSSLHLGLFFEVAVVPSSKKWETEVTVNLMMNTTHRCANTKKRGTWLAHRSVHLVNRWLAHGCSSDLQFLRARGRGNRQRPRTPTAIPVATKHSGE